MAKAKKEMTITVEKEEIIIRIPYADKMTFPETKSGKAYMVASTKGWMTQGLPDGVSLSMNMTKYKSKKEKADD